MSYFIDPSPYFGRLAWTFFTVQILIAAAGAYIAFGYNDRVQFRQTFFRNLGRALLVVGGVGVLIGALRLLNVPILNQRIWFYIQLVLELGLAGYIYYYLRTIFPQELAKAKQSQPQAARRGAAPRSLTSQGAGGSGATAPAEPRPVATTSRGEARRARKRKNK
jgi:hypothetical protein